MPRDDEVVAALAATRLSPPAAPAPAPAPAAPAAPTAPLVRPVARRAAGPVDAARF
jgi:hypothetical protein